MQQYGLELLLDCDERDKAEDLIERLKLSLVANNPDQFIETILPGVKREAEVDEMGEDEIDDMLDDTVGEWDFTQSEISAQEAQSILSGATTQTSEVMDLARFEGRAKIEMDGPEEDGFYDGDGVSGEG